MTTASDETPYSRIGYRRLIAWPERLRREWPLLEREIGQAPQASVVDLGAGTGEHARHLASRGIRAVGIDRSGDQIAQARDYEREYPPYGPEFLEGDLGELERLTDERFGCALCLGNVLPHLEDRDLARALSSLSHRLLPGGRLVLQLINYERVAAHGIRYLPLNFRDHPEGDGEIVFTRLLRPDGERHVLFFPTTLVLTPGATEPVRLETTREVRLRAWKRPEVEAALSVAGFAVAAVHGDMTGGDYSAEESGDLVIVAVLSSEAG